MSQSFTKDYVVKATGESNSLVVLTPLSTASGTAIKSFVLPSGVQRFWVHCNQVGTDGTNALRIRVGTGGVANASGYNSTSCRFTNTAPTHSTNTNSFIIERGNALDTVTGAYEFTLIDPATNKWVGRGNHVDTGNNSTIEGGDTALAGEIDIVTLDVNTDNWDGGEVTVSYLNPELAVSGIESVAAGVTDVFVNGTKQATTSGTEKDFTIPSGVKEIKVTLKDVGHSTTGFPLIRLGDSSGIYSTSGDYDSAYTWVSSTSQSTVESLNAFTFGSFGNTQAFSGTVTLTLHDAATNTWVCAGQAMTIDGTDTTAWCTGHIVLDSELTTIRYATTGTALDEGSVNVQYDNPELDLGSGVISGGVVQTVNVQDGAVATGTTAMPDDTSIPQITEGDEYMAASITPTNVGNKLRIDVIFNGATTSGDTISIALFQDSTADALAAAGQRETTINIQQQVTLTHWMDAGTTDSTTFSLRAGGVSGTLTFNGVTATVRYGGVAASSITITEYKA